jgi:hypothetical protein
MKNVVQNCEDAPLLHQHNCLISKRKEDGFVGEKHERDRKFKGDLSYPRRKGYSFQRPIDYSTGVLIQIWCRHQYLKGLLPSLMVFWFFGFYFLAANYEQDASSFYQNELKDNGCYLVSKEPLPFPKECHLLNHATEYNHLDNRGNAFLMTVICSAGDAVNLYYDTDYWGLTDNSYAFTILVNFLLPVIFTYFIYETIILALYDCLVIIPSLDSTSQKPVIQYVDHPYRVSCFILRDVYRSFTAGPVSLVQNDDCSIPLVPSPSAAVNHSQPNSSLHPGIRMSSISSLFINCFLFMIFFTIWNFGISSTNVYHCTDQSEYTTSSAKYSIESLLVIYLFLALIPTFQYYYCLFFFMKDIEILACSSYSEEFYQRRHNGIRNLFDLFPVLFFPLLANVFYYPFYLIPHYLCFNVFRGIGWLLRKIVKSADEEKRNSGQNDGWFLRMNDYYEKNEIFNLENRWYCSWFIREIDESEVVGGKELRKDDDENVGEDSTMQETL